MKSSLLELQFTPPPQSQSYDVETPAYRVVTYSLQCKGDEQRACLALYLEHHLSWKTAPKNLKNLACPVLGGAQGKKGPPFF